MRRTALSLAALLALAAAGGVAACGSGESSTTTTAVQACRRVAEPRPKTTLRMRRPHTQLAQDVAWKAVVTTNCGTFAITLDVAASPKTAASFASLARRGFYDRLTFHRIAPEFVIQGGDPLGNGLGDPGYSIVEPPPRDTRYVEGVVAMAKTATEADGTSGSQFFIVTVDDAQLPPQYALLGEVTQGYDVVEQIEQRPLQDRDPQGSPPVDPVVIEQIEIRRG